ncbi:MAG: hypothetical protein AAB683_02450 [Patescibacteria group bacterium]
MRKDKEKAVSLRKSGKSYLEIQKELGVPKSTLSDWLRDQNWSKELSLKLVEKAKSSHIIRLQELNKIRGENLQRLYKQATEEAMEEFEILKYHPLFIASMMIYWGEGDKLSRSRISLANTDPNMLRVFVYFLKKICNFSDSKIRAWILAYPDMNIEFSRRYWIENTGLSESNFRKTIVIQGKPTKRKLSHGVCTVELGSTYFKTKMLVWLRCFSKVLITDEYYAGIV